MVCAPPLPRGVGIDYVNSRVIMSITTIGEWLPARPTADRVQIMYKKGEWKGATLSTHQGLIHPYR